MEISQPCSLVGSTGCLSSNDSIKDVLGRAVVIFRRFQCFCSVIIVYAFFFYNFILKIETKFKTTGPVPSIIDRVGFGLKFLKKLNFGPNQMYTTK